MVELLDEKLIFPLWMSSNCISPLLTNRIIAVAHTVTVWWQHRRRGNWDRVAHDVGHYGCNIYPLSSVIFTDRPTDGPTDWLSDRRMVSYRYWVIHCKKRASLSVQIEFLGPFVRRLISATLGLNLIHVSLFLCSKAFKGEIFLILFRTFNDQIAKKKKIELNFLLKLSDLKSNFTLILGYLHPALNSPGQIVTLMWSLEPSAIRLMAVTCNFWLGRGGGGTMKRTPEFIPVVPGICHPPQVTFSSSN